MSEKTHQNSFNIVGLLGLLFIALKLCGVLGWSWWWVLAPFWFPVPIFIVAFVAGLVWHVIASYKK